MIAFAVLVEVLEVDVLDDRALDLLGGLPAFGDLGAIGNAAHVDLGDRRSLSGMEILRGEHNIEPAVDIEHVALANGRSDDLCHKTSL